MKYLKSQEIKLARVKLGQPRGRSGAIAKGALRLTAIAAVHALTLNPIAMPSAWGQIPPKPSPEAQTESPPTADEKQESAENPPKEEVSPDTSARSSPLFPNSLNNILSGTRLSEYPARPVRLDGRQLFSVVPIERGDGDRVEAIEEQLHHVIEVIEKQLKQKGLTNRADRETFINETLQIYNNPLHGLPIISAKWDGQEEEIKLVTVTSLDAQRLGMPREMVADRWQQEIRQGLLRALQERQPEYIREQFAQAAIVGLGIFLCSLTLASYQRRLKDKREKILAQNPPPPAESPPIAETESVDSTEQSTIETESIEKRQQTESMGQLQHKMTQQQQLNLNDIQKRLAQFGQIGIWGSGTYIILGLFPASRWVQIVILSFVPLPLKLIAVVLITYMGVRLSAIGIDRFFSALQDGRFIDAPASRRLALRFSTFAGVFKSISAAGFIGVGVLAALAAIGLDLAPVLAGAGIIGLGISLASQSLIKDTIKGFLILLEDQYAVGDVIVVGDVGGLVENMNLRITQLRNGEGRLITIPNSAICVVQNLSKEWARVDLTIEVGYNNDVDKVLMVLQQLADEIYSELQWREKIIDPPEVLGIDDIDHAGLLIRIWIKTKPLQHWSVGREFRRRIKTRLDEMGIAIGVPQQSVVFHNSLELLKQGRNGNGDRDSKLLPEHSGSRH